MSTRIAKEELALLMPNSLSHYFQDDASAMPQGAEGTSLIARATAAVRWLIDMPRRRAVLNELSGLSERELTDIGLTREALPHVFDNSYATRRIATLA